MVYFADHLTGRPKFRTISVMVVVGFFGFGGGLSDIRLAWIQVETELMETK